MATTQRGFASMSREQQREIASKGGKRAHEKGTAHEWTREEAQEAGRKGGRVRRSKSPLGIDAAGTAELEGAADLAT